MMASPVLRTCLLAAACGLAALPLQAQPAQPRPLTLHEALALPFAQRFAAWFDKANGANPEEGLAIGDSMVAEAQWPHERVWIPAQQAIYRTDRGYRSAATALLQKADAAAAAFYFRTLPDSGEAGFWKTRALHVLGDAHCHLATREGRLAEAQRWCRRSVEYAQQALLQAHHATGMRAAAEDAAVSAQLRLTELHLAAGQPEAATEPLQAALSLNRQTQASVPTDAWLQRAASRVAQHLGQHDEAVRRAQAAVSTWDRTLAPVFHGARVWGRVELQSALALQENWPALLAELADFQRMEEAAGRRLGASLLARSLAFESANRLGELAPALELALDRARREQGFDDPLTAVFQGLGGAALMQAELSSDTQGRADLAKAAAVLAGALRSQDLRLRHPLVRQAARLVLTKFLQAGQGTGPADAAQGSLVFGVADLLRGSQVQSAIQSAALRDATRVAGLSELVRQEQDLERQVQLVRTRLLSPESEARAPQAGSGNSIDEFTAELRATLLALIQQRDALRYRIVQRFPGYDRLAHPNLPTPQDVVRQLAVNELFVLMLPVTDGVHVWALGWTGQQHHFARMPGAELHALVNQLRRSTDFDASPLQPFASAAAWRLYQALLAPLGAPLRQARHLVVAAGGALGSVPFAALPEAEPVTGSTAEPAWLALRMAVSQVPSASAWLAIQRRAQSDRPPGSLIAWGDPQFDPRPRQAAPPRLGSPASGNLQRSLVRRQASAAGGSASAMQASYAELPALPETRDELRAIAQALQANPDSDLMLGASATRASVLAANASGQLAQRKVVAFATHGLMAGDLPNLNQPALALAATPDAETNPLAPLLTLDDVLGLRLNADWVVLSACNTAAADGRAEEAMSGLARGFFYAGARSVLVTHWAVETESAKLLTTRTFEHYTANPYAGKAESLRQAMLSVMAMPRNRHPAFWAPYALVGDGAR